jgi:hypothetical protein
MNYKELIKSKQLFNRKIALQGSLIFLLIVSIITLILYSLYYFDIKHATETIEHGEIYYLESIDDLIREKIEDIASDLMILKDKINLQSPSKINDKKYIDFLSKEFLILSKRKRIYDQIRLLYKTGMEIIRVNFNDGKPIIVPEKYLQFKGNRYYFKDTFLLGKDEIFISPFDMNIEHEAIEIPIKPMLRVGTPVFDITGSKQGILLLNYLGRDLLNKIDSISNSDQHGEVMFLNQEGFLFKENILPSFISTFPDAWQRIASEESGQFHENGNIFSFKTIHPLQTMMKSSTGSNKPYEPSMPWISHKQYRWKIVTLISGNSLKGKLNDISSKYINIAKSCLVISLILSWILSCLTYNKKRLTVS